MLGWAWHDWPLMCCYRYDGGGWVRMFGFGISWKNVNLHGLSFSQRNNYERYIRVGHWIIEVLKP